MAGCHTSRGPPTCVPLQGLPGFGFRRLGDADLDKASHLEAASYPADEAASREQLEYRFVAAPELFFGVYDEAGTSDESLVGFIVGTGALTEQLHEETMSVHCADAVAVCIHSVVVSKERRRQGVARAMVKAYVETISKDAERCASVQCILLLAKAGLLGLYAQCGFQLIGPSAVVHGAEQWFDMRLDIAATRRPRIMQVDVFSPAVFAGNPAAVVLTHVDGDEAWMQAVAAETAASATAFVRELAPATSCHHTAFPVWTIRWFSPTTELSICGHATIGAMRALETIGKVAGGETINFCNPNVKAPISCRKDESGWISAELPALSARQCTADETDVLFREAGIEPAEVVWAGRAECKDPDWIIEVTPKAFLLIGATGLSAQIIAFAARHAPRGIAVTCGGNPFLQPAEVGCPRAKLPRILAGSILASGTDDAFDFTTRYFAPSIGIPEDHATGGVHCVLAPYWASKLGKSPGTAMTALQASARGGLLRLRCSEDGKMVEVGGQAALVSEGDLMA